MSLSVWGVVYKSLTFNFSLKMKVKGKVGPEAEGIGFQCDLGSEGDFGVKNRISGAGCDSPSLLCCYREALVVSL